MISTNVTSAPGNTQADMESSTESRPSSDASNLVGLRARWRLLPTGWRATAVIVAAVLIAGGLIKVTSLLTEGSSPEGPDSSSFSPTSNGLAALSELLTRNGDHVVQLTTPLDGAAFPTDSTVVVAAPTSWQSADTTTLARVLDSGGNVVVAGQPPSGLLAVLLGARVPEWSANAVTNAEPVASNPLEFGVSQVDSTGPGSWSTAGGTTPLLASSATNPRVYVAVYARIGAGTVVLLSSPAPLQNRLLGQADNAAFAIDITGPTGTTGSGAPRSVIFDEYDHGYGRAGSGIGGLPGSWKAALLLALAAILVWMLSAARRFGPPEKAERELPPPRVSYVDAIATVLSTAQSESVASAAEPLQVRARTTLCRRAGVSADASDDEIARAAASAGLSGELVRTVLSTPRSADDLIAVGRA